MIKVQEWLGFLIIIVCLFHGYSLAQEEQSQDKDAIESLSNELSGELKLSEMQEGRIRSILEEFRDEMTGSWSGNAGNRQDELSPVDQTSKARQDKTDVKEEQQDEVGDNSRNNNNDDRDVDAGNAQTKSQSDEDNVIGRTTRVAVSFERARINADSRIDEMLTPEQAVKYGKIKSDWWDKVRERIQPDNTNR